MARGRLCGLPWQMFCGLVPFHHICNGFQILEP